MNDKQQTMLAQVTDLFAGGQVDAGKEKLCQLDLADRKVRKGLLRDVVEPLMQVENFKQAVLVLTELVKADDRDGPTMAKYALALSKDGQTEKAIKTQHQAVALAPDQVGYKSTLLLLLKRAERGEQACRFALENQNLWNEDARFAHISAMVLGRQGLQKDAIVAALIVAGNETITVNAARVVADVFLADNRFDDVEAVLEKAGLLSDVADVIRLIVWPAVERGDLDYGLEQIARLYAQNPESVEVLTLYGDILLRLGRAEKSVALLQDAVARQPDRAEAVLLLIQSLMRLEKLSNAYDLAIQAKSKWLENRHLTVECARLLKLVGDGDNGLDLARQIYEHHREDGELMEIAARLQLQFSSPQQAQVTCETALAGGHDGTVFQLLLAKSLLALNKPDHAIDVLQQVADLPGCDPEAMELLSELLAEKGQPRQAEKYLAKLVAADPDNVGFLVKHGMVLKLLRKNDQAGETLLRAIELDGGSEGTVRAAMACLMQTGRKQEAEKLYQTFQDKKRAVLPDSLADGLLMAGQFAKELQLPADRLNWVWEIVQKHTDPEKLPDRGAWEKAAKTGYLADQLLSAWLEGKPESRKEVSQLFVGLDQTFDKISQIAATGKGLIVASAHVGPMYAGPLAFYEMGWPCKWVAAVPSLSSLGYGDLLISTIEQSELAVVDAVYKSLGKGEAVLIAVDGADHPAAATTEFEGRMIRYSDFVARASFKRNVPSAFGVSLWNGQTIRFEIFAMPRPEQGEKIEDFVARWNKAFFDQLRKVLLLGPENLRLGGGLWR